MVSVVRARPPRVAPSGWDSGSPTRLRPSLQEQPLRLPARVLKAKDYLTRKAGSVDAPPPPKNSNSCCGWNAPNGAFMLWVHVVGGAFHGAFYVVGPMLWVGIGPSYINSRKSSLQQTNSSEVARLGFSNSLSDFVLTLSYILSVVWRVLHKLMNKAKNN